MLICCSSKRKAHWPAVQAGGDSVQRAIALAASAPNSKAVGVVVSHLQAMEGMEERLVELHLAVGQPQQACAVALARAQAEQASGNYKVGAGQEGGGFSACSLVASTSTAASVVAAAASMLMHFWVGCAVSGHSRGCTAARSVGCLKAMVPRFFQLHTLTLACRLGAWQWVRWHPPPLLAPTAMPPWWQQAHSLLH